jgi:t-SNARE complex subunit (syntaxin)
VITDKIRVSPQELEFQETLIAEREAEIREIESGIHELNDIFRDLGTIVQEQGGLIGTVHPPQTLRIRADSQITSSQTSHPLLRIHHQQLRN